MEVDSRTIACIEVGGSGSQTVFFAGSDQPAMRDGVDPAVHEADLLLLAVPGIIEGNRVLGASNLGWYDVDPAIEMGMDRSADIVLNDAEAAALGEAALRGVPDLTFVGLGTGVGGAIIGGGEVVESNLFGHEPGFSDDPCVCGQTGCLETVAGGWALPTPLDAEHPSRIADALAEALARHRSVKRGPVVVTGGLARRYPAILEELSLRMTGFAIEGSAAPSGAKSAAAWGLRHAAFDIDPSVDRR